MTRTTTRLVAGMLSVGLVFAACGDDDDTETTTGQVTSTTGAEADEEQATYHMGEEELRAIDHGQTFTAADAGGEIRVAPAEQFRIELESNITTGYDWEVASVDPESLVTLENREHTSPEQDSEEPMVGAGGTTVLVFVADASGSGTLTLEYVQGFGEESEPDQVLEFTVVIEG